MLDFKKDCRNEIYQLSDEDLFNENILLLLGVADKAEGEVVHTNYITFIEEIKRRKKANVRH